MISIAFCYYSGQDRSKLPCRDAELIEERLQMAVALDRSLTAQALSKESGHG
jgi:hypothetical protein